MELKQNNSAMQLDPTDPFSPTQEEVDMAEKMIAACENNPGKRSLEEERDFMENLLVQRLSCFFVVYSIILLLGFTVLASGFTVIRFLFASLIFIVGTFLCMLMAKVVYRAHVKHHWIMRLFYFQKISADNATDDKLPHAIKFINDAMKKHGRDKFTKKSVSTLVGKTIPRVCWISLLVCSVLSLLAVAYIKLPSVVQSVVWFSHTTEGTISFLDPNGVVLERKGRLSHKLRNGTIEVKMVDSTGKDSIIIIPLERLVSIERASSPPSTPPSP
ncbi:MAG: hypothetical protein JXA82_06965 [Sedimentisphaerales bacterium]|nr:hypothetical protein [Sedimentisphaerales bacterium]